MKKSIKVLLTGVVVLVAVAAALLKYRDSVLHPRTRDGQVRANVIQITPRVSGPIVKLGVQDNQFVKAGDLLFEIDPRTTSATCWVTRAGSRPRRRKWPWACRRTCFDSDPTFARPSAGLLRRAPKLALP